MRLVANGIIVWTSVFYEEYMDEENHDVIRRLVYFFCGGGAITIPVKFSDTSDAIQVALRQVNYGLEVQCPDCDY